MLFLLVIKLYYATASANVFVGYHAGYGSDSLPYSSGGKNVGVGYESQKNFTTGNQNTSLGASITCG